jgi:hypothetical protein
MLDNNLPETGVKCEKIEKARGRGAGLSILPQEAWG